MITIRNILLAGILTLLVHPRANALDDSGIVIRTNSFSVEVLYGDNDDYGGKDKPIRSPSNILFDLLVYSSSHLGELRDSKNHYTFYLKTDGKMYQIQGRYMEENAEYKEIYLCDGNYAKFIIDVINKKEGIKPGGARHKSAKLYRTKEENKSCAIYFGPVGSSEPNEKFSLCPGTPEDRAILITRSSISKYYRRIP